jgi:hypothetical protein
VDWLIVADCNQVQQPQQDISFSTGWNPFKAHCMGLLHIKPGLRPLVAELENVTILAWNRVKSVGQKRRERKAKCRPADPVTV